MSGNDPHLTTDELDAWLTGSLPPLRMSHLETCDLCAAVAEAERTLINELNVLPRFAPSASFSNHIIATLAQTNPSLASTRRHLSGDELDEWLAGALPLERTWHLEVCPECLAFAEAEQVLAEQLRRIPLFSPTPGFADRVVASLAVSTETARQPGWRAAFSTFRARALAAGAATVLLASMAGSIVWTWTHQALLAAVGSRLSEQAQQWFWVGLRGAFSNLIEQPWYSNLHSLAASPARLALASGLASALYCTGLLAFRRLLALPLPDGPRARA